MNPLGFAPIKKSVLYILSGLIFYTCFHIPEEKGICVLYCDPEDCMFLDEEKCECIKDLDCIYEKYYEVDLRDYKCDSQNGGIWCSALTGDSIQTWEFVYAYDTIRNDTIVMGEFYYGFYYNIWFDFPNGIHRYEANQVYFNCFDIDDCPSNFTYFYFWKFDRLTQPEKIIYTPIEGSQQDKFERTIIKLTPDTLITTWHEGEFPGWILLVPNDS